MKVFLKGARCLTNQCPLFLKFMYLKRLWQNLLLTALYFLLVACYFFLDIRYFPLHPYSICLFLVTFCLSLAQCGVIVIIINSKNMIIRNFFFWYTALFRLKSLISTKLICSFLHLQLVNVTLSFLAFTFIFF